jgi:hypothetical protein
MLRIQLTDKWIITIRKPKLLLLNIIITWVMLLLWALDLIPKWWYNFMYSIGGGGSYYVF